MKGKGFFAATAGFLKKNIYYVLLILCVAAIATIIIVAVTYNKNAPSLLDPIVEDPGTDPILDPDPTDPVITVPMTFMLPIQEANLGHDFSFSNFVFMSTQNRWQTHKGIDFHAEIGTSVHTVYDGTVTSVYTDILNGTVIIIGHIDGISSVYKSLDSKVNVSVGDTVRTNDVIGYVSDSMFYEIAEGPHLHFEVWRNGVIINPYTYFLDLQK